MNIASNFSGWMSQDDFFVGKWQSIYSHGIDLLRSPSELKLMPWIEKSAFHDTSMQVTSIFSPVADLVWYARSDGWIREYETGNGVIQISNPSQIISNWILFLGNFYIFTDRYVYKTTYSAGALSGISTWYDPWTNEWWHHPVSYQGGEMYFPSGKNVKYTDSTGTLQTLFSVDFSNNVRGLSIQGSNLRIYSDKLISIVDIGTKTVSYSQVLPFTPTGVTTDWIIDYVTTDSNELYTCSGLEWRKIAGKTLSPQLEAYTNSPKFTFTTSKFSPCISYSNGVLYTINQEEDRIMAYGRKMEWIPNAFAYLPVTSAQTTTLINEFSCVFALNGEVYTGHKVGSDYQVWRMSYTRSEWNCANGVYIIPPTDFGDYSILKQIEEIRVGKTGTGGELWCSINEATFELVGALDQTDLEQKFMTYKKDFRQISFMIKLSASSDVVRNIDLRFTNRIV